MNYWMHETGYLVPALTLDGQPMPPLNKYGSLRREFLRQNAPALFEEMTLMGSLYGHLLEMGEAVQQAVNETMNRLLKEQPNPYDRKSQPVEWAGWMNSLKQQAEELAAPMLYAL